MTSILPWLLIIIALGVLLWTAIRAPSRPRPLNSPPASI
jgi:hypothetical protein